MTAIPLMLTPCHACSYLEGREARSAFVHPDCRLTASIYESLIEHGFRRSGDDVYRPHCQHCAACIPVRLAVACFKPNRSQKRCRQRNADIQVVVKRPVFEQAHYAMYLRYQAVRHGDGDMANSSPEDYLRFLSSSWCDTRFVEFSIDRELAAVAVVDYLDNALSAVYTFFEPKFSDYSPGTYAVLWQIEQAKLLGKDYLYLGFWIAACKKMAYKSHFRPLQLLVNDRWSEYAP